MYLDLIHVSSLTFWHVTRCNICIIIMLEWFKKNLYLVIYYKLQQASGSKLLTHQKIRKIRKFDKTIVMKIRWHLSLFLLQVFTNLHKNRIKLSLSLSLLHFHFKHGVPNPIFSNPFNLPVLCFNDTKISKDIENQSFNFKSTPGPWTLPLMGNMHQLADKTMNSSCPTSMLSVKVNTTGCRI